MTIVFTTILFFLTILSFSFLKLLFFSDDEVRTFQKILGGLAVFVVALVANNAFVYIASVFIGGLIIASENFLLLLAAILRSKDIPAAISALGSIKTSKASQKEIEDKIKTEEITIEEEIPPEISATEIYKSSNPKVNERLKRVAMVEELVNIYLKKKFGDRYLEHRKLTTSKGSIITDGVVININRKIKYIVEIKYITEKSFPRIKYILNDLTKRMYDILGRRNRLLTVLISDAMDIENAKMILESNKQISSFLFFKFEGEKITSIIIE